MIEAKKPRMPVTERILSKVEKQSSGCWKWTASHNGRYARMTFGQHLEYAHRVSYTVFKGAIPDGYDIDHLCGNKLCVNPDHLDAVPHVINIRRWRKTVPDANGNVTCPKCGHVYRLEHSRSCQLCRKRNDSLRHKRNRLIKQALEGR